jgi:hypothetical protein
MPIHCALICRSELRDRLGIAQALATAPEALPRRGQPG